MNDPSAGTAAPIFITGLDRSGKTRLRLLLNRHADIHIARRTALLSTLDGAFGDLRQGSALDSLVRAIARRPGLDDAMPPIEELRATTQTATDAYAAVFRTVLARHAMAHGASRWGEQDTELIWRTRRLVVAYPSARVVHVIRDPRSRHAMVRQDRPRTIGLVGASTAAWLSSARIALADQAREPDRYRIVRSEDLAEDADPSVATELALGDVPPSLSARGSVEPGPNAPDARFVERHAAAEMRALGYLPSPRSVRGWRAAGDRIAPELPARIRFHARCLADRRRVAGRSRQS